MASRANQGPKWRDLGNDPIMDPIMEPLMHTSSRDVNGDAHDDSTHPLL
jgi:hypothetical protein